MIQSKFVFDLDWQTIEKAAWFVGSGIVVALLTIARPWLGRQVLKLLKEDKGSYQAFVKEMWPDVFTKLDEAASNAKEALRKIEEMKETMERLESASAEQGEALAELTPIPRMVERMSNALESFLKEFTDMKILTARIDERQKSRSSSSTPTLR